MILEIALGILLAGVLFFVAFFVFGFLTLCFRDFPVATLLVVVLLFATVTLSVLP